MGVEDNLLFLIFNLVYLSILNNYGLIGVAIGTIIAMVYRIIFQVYLTKKIINRNQKKFYKVFCCF